MRCSRILVCELDFTAHPWYIENMDTKMESQNGQAPGRAIHLIDVENLVGSACFTCSDAALVHRAYESVATVSAGDHLILASSHHAAPSTWFAWPHSARRLVRSGLHGADRAL